MYETEINHKIESASEAPAECMKLFKEVKNGVIARTLIPWGEHCTECGWPSCYSTCDLYVPREDLKCRRFVDGMVRVDCDGAFNGYLLKIRFKRWGKLWARGNFRLYPLSKADQVERRDHRIGIAIQYLPNALKRKTAVKRYVFKKRLASRATADERQLPTGFLLECFNPGKEKVRLSLTIRSLRNTRPVRFPNLVQIIPGFPLSRELAESQIPFQRLVEIAPGFHRETIPFEDIMGVVDPHLPFAIDITPNDVQDEVTLYFGAIDFVYESKVQAKKSGTVKCVVWDLDGTLWDGILVEDGPEKLRLKPRVLEVLRELDRRGILHSIASKNNHEEALAVLRRFGLENYFLSPQISWQPKSEGIQSIARELSIGLDALLFVDDSEFERQEVSAICPSVKVLRADLYTELLTMPECKVTVTTESALRRQMYQTENSRRAAAGNFGQDYLAFLRYCEIRLRITRLGDDNLERVWELTQRTNQMNFSGKRYDRATLKAIIDATELDTYVLACEDRFGSYGIIGFAIVESHSLRMTDLMFSCRVQSKRVEHAFLTYIISKYFKKSEQHFVVTYKRTARNTPAAKVFKDLSMHESHNQDGMSDWVFEKEREPFDEGIISIEDLTDSLTAL